MLELTWPVPSRSSNGVQTHGKIGQPAVHVDAVDPNDPKLFFITVICFKTILTLILIFKVSFISIV